MRISVINPDIEQAGHTARAARRRHAANGAPIKVAAGVSVAALAFALTACAPDYLIEPVPTEKQDHITVSEPDPGMASAYDAQIAHAADRTATASQTLAMISRTRTEPRPFTVDAHDVPAELQRAVTMNWAGPGEEAVRALANAVGYRFEVTGQKPSTPVMVSLEANKEAAVYVFEDLGMQTQPYASVIVNPSEARVTYRYDANTSLAGTLASTGGEVAGAHRNYNRHDVRGSRNDAPPLK